ncbi:response regulator [Gilvimarinus sp. SDUM040013]|uniref:histidine kinase n=1 Tax=Gilvimarinus gilvus TaxID=3058038 RepID=A0ABU4S1R1_9GAMM|nr:PAS domain-containing hybrid sensor histidine kinase/response regulator [Gilvimarinus sp. SDUM040013]MDO3384412.1 response regulator [Gilvimarinus sp. SDUM040013]MDX6851017.1 response regulator [Gilvimarinus sp. SDUM040013]
MTNQGKDTSALEARVAQLEQALAILTQSAGESSGQGSSALQRHFALLLGEASLDDIQASLLLLSEQLNIQPLTLWSVDKTINHWQLIASQSEDTPPALESSAIQVLRDGFELPLPGGNLIPIQIRQHTLAVLCLPTDIIEPLLQFAIKIATLMWEAFEHNQLIQKLRERDKRFRYAMRASSNGLWDWDLTRNKIYFSSGYLRMLGYDYEPMPGTLETLKNYFIHPDDLDNVLQEFNTAIHNGREHLRLEHRVLHKNGNTLWVHSQCIFVEPDPHGTPTRCVGTNAEITQSIADREELLKAKAEAELASQTKSKFLGSMSHEIRTPMNAILGLGHLLNDTALDSQQKSYLDSINHAANSLLQTINQVFDYAKLETGHIILENAHFDLEHVFERLSRMFESATVHKPVNIIFDIADEVPRFLRGDAVRLGHIISHLVTNALQYSNSDEIVVNVENLNMQSDKVQLRFNIIDHGKGLKPKTLQALQHDLNTRPHAGAPGKNGFGLQICKLLVQLMNGQIDIVSKPGKGAKFSFSADFEHSHIGDHRISSEHSSCRALRLLVIDDNQLALDILAKSAGKLVDHVDTASNAADALKKIIAAEKDHRAYDLLLLDYKMPLRNGLEAAREIKKSNKIKQKPKIFLVSSFQRDEIFLQHKDADFVDDFLSKPVSESRLFDAICRALPECLTGDDQSSDDEQHTLLKGKRVLLVEDNLVNQQVACGIMKKKGITVINVDNGQQAVDRLTGEEHFDAVLMDIEMPVLNGLEATAAIRIMHHRKHLPIVAVTAQAMAGDRERCLEIGMNDYISKPINPQILYQTLADLLNGHKFTVNH